jgi:hypothetical protein
LSNSKRFNPAVVFVRIQNRQLINFIIMKRTVRTTGIVIMLLLACNITINAQRGMRGVVDSTRINSARMGTYNFHRQGMGTGTDSLWIKGMRHGKGFDHFYGSRQFMRHPGMYGMGPGMRGGMGRGSMAGFRGGMRPVDRMGSGQRGPGMLMLESIPNVTEKQKKDIADLQKKQTEEMKKFREDMSAKMQAMRESHRQNILNILTDEQKKFLESKNVKVKSVPEKTK